MLHHEFKDRNSERYTISLRIEKLIRVLRGRYFLAGRFSPGTFRIREGLYSYGELNGLEFGTYDGKEERWGGPNRNVWFVQRFAVPESMAGRRVYYGADLTDNGGWYWGAPQILAYVNGVPAAGMDVNHREILLSDHASAGEEYEVALCAFTDRIFYKGKVEMNMAVMAVNPLAEQLYYDVKVPYDVAMLLDGDDTRRIDILEYLDHALTLVDFRLPPGDAFDATLRDAIGWLGAEFYGKFCGHAEETVTCVGHTHIDTAWLWTLEQTRKKVARSFSTVLSLMREYDDFTFMSSQPQLYEFLSEDHPEIFSRIRPYAESGRWEAEGGMWVEADTNITGGESLVRQFLFGKRYFKEHFGADNRILWLPDVFGYSGSLPQIMKKSEIDYFMTTKISWNDYDKLPYDTFRWRGIDGSEVLSHFICTQDYRSPEGKFITTYNGDLNPSSVMGAWKRYQQKDLNRDILLSFGHGDGGGGPTREMIECGRRMSKGIPGCPAVRFGTALDYFRKLDKEVSGRKRLPVWSGELYFEYHRGTYTSIAKIKKNNRKAEILLQETEWLGSMDRLTRRAPYPREEINAAWKLFLLNQFHDILPGSSIKEVYEDSDAQFRTIFRECGSLRDAAAASVAGGIGLGEESLVVFNSTAYLRSDVAEAVIPYERFGIFDGDRPVPWQKTAEGTTVFFVRDVPPKGYKTFTLRKSGGNDAGTTPPASPLSSGAAKAPRSLTTAFWHMELDGNGNIVSLSDRKSGKEYAVPGEPMNRLCAFEDMPPGDDAWNINAYIYDKSWNLDEVRSAEVTESGPVRTVVRIERPFMRSSVRQEIILYEGMPRIDIRSRIDWKESNILLKADFPVDVNAVRAAYDIQFGNIERSTTTNTTWDFAQFEVSAHRWADLSQEDHGLSVLNDCKYGYDIKDRHLRITLLKSAVYPNPDADKEVHEFTYSIYPHAGGWRSAGTDEAAAFLNCPLLVRAEQPHPGRLPAEYSFVRTGCRNVVIDTVKQAEDSGDTVVRLYENHNASAQAELTFAGRILDVRECDLMENEICAIPHGEHAVTVGMAPYEIKTLRITWEENPA